MAIEATGFIKFREVIGGAFSAGALTFSGAGAATAAGADVTGWIEVVQRQAVANTVPRLGSFKTRGDWFYLDNTNGSAGQILQVPTNGGGVNTRVPAIWIETGNGTNEYDIYPAVKDTWFLAANLGTDIRSKFVRDIGDGQVMIGQDATAADAGYTPASGCKVRIPNILGRQSTLAAGDAVNQLPHATLASRPDFTTTSAGEIDFEYFMNDWYHLFASPYKVRMVNCATFDIHSTSNEASPTYIDNYTTGAYQAGTISLTMLNNPLGGTIKNSRFVRPDAASNGHCISMTGCSNFNFDTVRTGVVQYARSTGAITFSQCRNFEFNNITTYCATLVFATSSNFKVLNFNYIDRLVGVSNSTTGKYAIQCTVSSNNIYVDGVILSYVADLAPYLGVFNSSNSSNLTFRNCGSFASPVDVNAAAAPAYVFLDSGNNDGVRVQRCYLEATRTAPYVTINTSKNITFENVQGTVGSQQTLAVNALGKGLRCASNSVTGGASVYGTHWFDMFASDTAGRIWLAFNEPTAFSADQYQAVSLGTGAGFTSAGQLVMPNVGDEIIFTAPYYILGHTALANTAPTLTGTNTGNFTYQYQIDKNDGNGWGGVGGAGVWNTLNGATLSSETVNPTGFKLKFRVVTATANSGNALTYIRIDTVSTAVAQAGNLYPLDYAVIELTGLEANSRVQLYDTTNNAELYNAVVTGTSLTYSTPYVANFNCRVRVMKQSGATANEFVEFTESVTIEGITRAITPEADAIYNLNAIDGSTITGITIDDSTSRININTGTLSLQDIYAYETYWLYTQAGIRDSGRFTTAIDQANYSFASFKIKNIQAGSTPLVITGGWMKDSVTSQAIDVIDTSGGTVFLSPMHVVPFSTSGGGGSTAAEIWGYSTRALTSGGVSSIQSGLAPAGEYDARMTAIQADLDNPDQYKADVSGISPSAIADAVWDELVASHVIVGSTGEALADAASGSVDAGAIADAVWDELITGHVVLDSAGKTVAELASSVWTQSVRALSTEGVSAIQSGLAPANEYDSELAAIQADLDNPNQYKADVSALALKNEYDIRMLAIQADLDDPDQYKANVSGLSTFNATTDNVTVGNPNDCKADVSGLATEANATTNKNTIVGEVNDNESKLVTIQSDLDNPDQYKANVSGLALKNEYDTELAAIPDSIMNSIVSNYQTEGSAGQILFLINAILRNKTITNPITGVMEVYDNDGGLLVSAKLYEDAAGTQDYRGKGAERRERLQ